MSRPRRHPKVIRRVGGLEESHKFYCLFSHVIRRVGGLEVEKDARAPLIRVIRRVGGLDGKGTRLNSGHSWSS